MLGIFFYLYILFKFDCNLSLNKQTKIPSKPSFFRIALGRALGKSETADTSANLPKGIEAKQEANDVW